MKPLFALLTLFAVAFVATAAPAASPEQDYMLNCMGCHQADGFGSPGRVPPLVSIDRFLAFPEGRDYLVRVPGVAHVGLSDERLAALLNWTIARFGRSQFREYTTEEVAPLRKRPFLNAVAARRRIKAQLEQIEERASGGTMRWKMNCPGPVGSSIAEGHMTVTDTTAKGAMTNTMNMNSQTMTMYMEWDGKRLGDCP